ncbi:MAG: MotA/TolQ/ExbB proton channel family protein [Deltaproteobacteria bacterium]|nr:MotA/TolQ/ExbB proton channel family protein [Deltaproteobacteria bacterium]MBN2671147.1 MotA/TolQ/ExbB proton channel family protein [Deltaproteobacteria bacterium]
MKEAFEFLKNGGVVMIPIALGSVIALAIFLERMWSLRQSKIVPSGLIQSVLELVSKKEFSKARDLCLSSNSPTGRVLQAGIDARDGTRQEIKERFEETGRQEVTRMDKFIEAMGTTASVEPLLGLLGTVTGMIKVFKKVVGTASSGVVDPAQLAGGIWQALITTAAGLSVAIIAFVGYRYLQSKSLRRSMQMEEGSMSLLDLLRPVAASAEKKSS